MIKKYLLLLSIMTGLCLSAQAQTAPGSSTTNGTTTSTSQTTTPPAPQKDKKKDKKKKKKEPTVPGPAVTNTSSTTN